MVLLQAIDYVVSTVWKTNNKGVSLLGRRRFVAQRRCPARPGLCAAPSSACCRLVASLLAHHPDVCHPGPQKLFSDVIAQQS